MSPIQRSTQHEESPQQGRIMEQHISRRPDPRAKESCPVRVYRRSVSRGPLLPSPSPSVNITLFSHFAPGSPIFCGALVCVPTAADSFSEPTYLYFSSFKFCRASQLRISPSTYTRFADQPFVPRHPVPLHWVATAPLEPSTGLPEDIVTAADHQDWSCHLSAT